MSSQPKTPLQAFRARIRQRGLVRVEVHVPREDAALIRSAARALVDPPTAPKARSILRATFASPGANLKELLASAPLEGVDLDRPRDAGRPVDL